MVATLRMNAGTLMKGITDAVSSVEDMGRSFTAQAASMGGLEKASANYIRSLERQALAAGTSKEAHLELKRVWDIIDYGDTEAAIKRIDAAYDKLADNLRKTKDASVDFWMGPGTDPAKVQAFQGQIDQLAAGAAKLGIALSGVSYAVVGFAKEAFNLGSQFQQAEIAFGTMLKSGEDAQVFLNELRNFAARTPFEFTDLLEASKRMMALGFAAQDVLPMMRSIGDAVSGLGGGKPLIDRITLALGQMRAATKVTQQDMMQLTNAGIGAWQILADKMNMSIAEVKKNASAGVINAAQAIPLILEGISEQFGNMMEKQVETAEGQMSNFKDKMGFIMTDIGKTLIPFANMVLQNVLLPVLTMVEKVAKGFAELSFPMQGIIVTLGGLFAAIGPAALAFAGFLSTISSLAGFFGTAGIGATLSALASTVLPPLAAAVIAVSAAWLLWDIPAVKDAVNSLISTLTDFWHQTLVPLGTEIKALGIVFGEIAGDIISSGLETIWTGLKELSSILVTNFKDLQTATDELGNSLGKFSELKPDSPLIDMLVVVGKLYAAIVHQGLIYATEAQIAIWKVLFAVVKELIELSFKPLEAVIWLITKAVDVLTGRMWLLAPAFKASFAPIELLIYAIKQIPGAAALIDAAFKNTGEAISNFGSRLAGTSAALKTAGVDINSPLQQLKALRESLVAAEANLATIQKTFQETGKGALQLAEATELVRKKKEAIGVAVKNLEPTFQALRKAVDNAREGYLATQKELAKVGEDFEKGKVKTTEYAAAQEKARAAQDTLKAALAALNTVLKDAGIENTKYSGTLEDMKKRWEENNKTSRSLGDQHKAQAEAVKQATYAYNEALKAYEKGTGTYERVIATYSKLRKAQQELDPAKVAAAQAKADSDMAKSQETLKKSIEDTSGKIQKVNEDIKKGTQDLALDYAKSHEKMEEATKKPIAILPVFAQAINATNAAVQAAKNNYVLAQQEVVKLRDSVEKGTASWADLEAAQILATQAGNDWVTSAKAFEAETRKAIGTTGRFGAELLALHPAIRKIVIENDKLSQQYAEMGMKTPAQLAKATSEAKKSYEGIAKSAGENSVAALEAWVEYETRRQTEARRAGVEITKAQKKALEEAEKDLDKALGRQVTGWQKFGNQVSTIITDLGRNLAKAFIDLTKGLLGFDDFNKNIKQQQEELSASLQERANELTKFREDTAAKEQELVQQYAQSLAAQEKALQDSLDERDKDYDKYKNSIAAKMETVRENHANSLAKELHDLSIKLKDKEEEYEKYVYEVSQKEEELTTKYQDQLDNQLASLRESLADRVQDFSDFVTDANAKLADIGKDLLESISDDQKSTDRKREDASRNHNRKVEDLNKDLAEAIKKKDKEREADIRLQLSREAEDHERTSRRIEEDLAEQVDDAKNKAIEQTNALKNQLAIRTRDFKAYIEDNKKKEQEAREESAKNLDKDLKELQENLAERTQELIKFRADTARLRVEAIAENAADLANDLKALQDNLDEKTSEYEDFKKAAVGKLAAIREANALELEKATQKLQDELGEQLGEYDKFVTGVVAKINDLENQLKGPLDRIRELFGSVFTSAIEAVLRLASEEVIGYLIKQFKGPLIDAIKGIGSAIGGVLGIGSKVAGTVSTVVGEADELASIISAGGTAAKVGGAASNAATTAASVAKAASGALGMVNAASSVLSAVTDVLSFLGQRHIEKDVAGIEVTTRAIFAEIFNLRVDEWDREDHLMRKLDDVWRTIGEGFGNDYTRLGDILDGILTKGDQLIQAVLGIGTVIGRPMEEVTESIEDQITKLRELLSGASSSRTDLEQLHTAFDALDKLYGRFLFEGPELMAEALKVVGKAEATAIATGVSDELKQAFSTLYSMVASGAGLEDHELFKQLSTVTGLIQKEMEGRGDYQELGGQISSIESTIKKLEAAKAARDKNTITHLVDRVDHWGAKVADLLAVIADKISGGLTGAGLDIKIPSLTDLATDITSATAPVADQVIKRAEDIQAAMQQVIARVQAVRDLATGDYTPSKELVELWTSTTKSAALEYNQLVMELSSLSGSLHTIGKEPIDLQAQGKDVYGLVQAETNPLLSGIYSKLMSLPTNGVNPLNGNGAASQAINLKLSLNGRSVGVAMTEDTDTLVPGI